MVHGERRHGAVPRALEQPRHRDVQRADQRLAGLAVPRGVRLRLPHHRDVRGAGAGAGGLPRPVLRRGDEHLPQAPGAETMPYGGPPEGWPCRPDSTWDGSVHVRWDSLGVAASAARHVGHLLVDPGQGASLIHVTTHCTGAVAVDDRGVVRRLRRHAGGRGQDDAGAEPAAGQLDRVRRGQRDGGHGQRPGLLAPGGAGHAAGRRRRSRSAPPPAPGRDRMRRRSRRSSGPW